MGDKTHAIFPFIKNMRRGNNNNRRRQNTNQRNNRNGPNAKRTQQDATRTTTRTLNRITNLNLSSVGPNGGTVTYATVLNPLSAFAGSASLLEQYEQFRIQKIAVYARADSANQPAVAGSASQSEARRGDDDNQARRVQLRRSRD